jgi:hypothetical protein
MFIDDSVPGVGELPSIRVRRCAPGVGVFGEGAIRRNVIRAVIRGEPVALGRVDASYLRGCVDASLEASTDWNWGRAVCCRSSVSGAARGRGAQGGSGSGLAVTGSGADFRGGRIGAGGVEVILGP